jgi:HEAT repeat protein
LVTLVLLSGFLTAVVVAPYGVSGLSRTVFAQQYTFEEVASGLKHQDPATRLRAIQILKDADYAAAAAPIAALLEDPDDRVQLAAIDAERSLFTSRPVSRRRKVGFVVEVRTVADMHTGAQRLLALKPRFVPADVLAGLAAALRDGNPRVRAETIDVTSLLAPHTCVPRAKVDRDVCNRVGNALIDNINSREPLLRRAAMRALGMLRYPNAVQALSDQLSYYQSGPDAHAALEGLAGIGHPASASAFRQLLTSSNAELRRLGVEGLARAGERDALSELQQLGQTERSNRVLLSLHFANVTLDEPRTSVGELIAALRNRSLRDLALQYLLHLAPSMPSVLSQSLQAADADTRWLIAEVLGFSGEPNVIAALEAAAKDPDVHVAAAAQRAIERIKATRGADTASLR